MQVVHVVRQFYPSIGGMEEVVLNIARYQMNSCGHKPRVVTLNRIFGNEETVLPAHDEYCGVPIRRLPYIGSLRYPLCPSVLREVKNADVIHVHGIDFFFDYLAITLPWHHKPLVASTHGGFFHTSFASHIKRLWFGTITRASSRAYSRIVATSENDGLIFRRVVPSDRLEIIENGVDVDKFAAAGNTELGHTLIYFGRWSINKGLIQTLDLLHRLVEKNPKWRLIVAGREFDLREAELLVEIEARGLANHVLLVPGPTQQQLIELLAKANYFICLSRHEGFGIAAIEAMSAGLVPILSDIPPFAKLCRSSGLGVLVRPEHVSSVVENLEALAAVDRQAYQIRRRKAQEFSTQFAWRKAASQYVECYLSVLGDQS